ncbi:hypothetical protein [Gilvimarinus algae]|uniref:ATPase n=1 Tax=Gilvimarinus algae TaxID=3058037 RepID=A0ABT8TBH1_9GAMM|nr:hypothetical protein [Gilvimarinus sp. SDUM040014]MDO3380934.1 hypothetical protein [Gilvimarinus sp. SDUM040014]
MAMIPKTLDEVLSYTHAFHERLAYHLLQCQGRQPSEREQMLLLHLAQQEKKLASTIAKLQGAAHQGVLGTWYYEYTDRHPIAAFQPDSIDFSDMDCDAISATIAELHDQLVDLYRHMHDRSESNSAKEFTAELLDIQCSQAKLVSFDSGRVQEI